MTEADEEILQILKDLFRNKDKELIDPDDLLREQIVKWSIYLSIFTLLLLLPAKILGYASSNIIDGFLSGVIAGQTHESGLQ